MMGRMVVDFVKMNGAGNDFIFIDNRSRAINLSTEQVIGLCHRQRGVGADGLCLLIPCASGKADWAWEFYNSDGSVADMCGNASRCFARFIQKTTGQNSPITFETGAGVITAVIHEDHRVTINLTNPKDLAINEILPLSTGSTVVHSLNTGVPHAVIFVSDVTQVAIQQLGPEIRRHKRFSPKGTNVNFVQVLSPGVIRVRTFERGVEGETLACGTGVTASALISSKVHGFSTPVKVWVQGGDLMEVHFQNQESGFSDIRLNGPADFAFKGSVEIEATCNK
jgi:diaminopimelate epimerase